MAERIHDQGAEPEASLAEELAAIPYEPLLPAEKWLIGVSLILGVILLAVLTWASATFFPVATPQPAGLHAANRRPDVSS